MTPSFKAAILEHAKQLGFTACGVAAPDAAAPELPYLLEWISSGYADNLPYLKRNPAARCSASALLPGCRSVIAVALPCAALDPVAVVRDGGKVARYAQGADYHVVIRGKLELLAAHIDELAPGYAHKITVDTSPVLEKAFAVAAGIGWRGHNTLVLNVQSGSQIMLGLLLTTLELPPDAPQLNWCGNCSRCIAACPTGALAEPGVLDPQLCISFWTTAAKSTPPPGFDLHGWAYGCDACQDACPYNLRLAHLKTGSS